MSPDAAADPELRELLRGLPVFAGELPPFVADLAGDPTALFARWLREAVDAGIREPHAMVLSTVDPAGLPDARTLILKSLVADGRWRFAGSAESAKGRALASMPAAALTFYWPVFGRQIRVRGPVEELDADECAADFLARGVGARAAALADSAGFVATGAAGQAEALALVEADPTLVAPEWRVWEVVADQVEFLQGAPSRDHVRVRYARTPAGWSGSRINA